jgi:hypothetical protein
MRTEIDRWDPAPVYARLAGVLRGPIERGELIPRQRGQRVSPAELACVAGHWGPGKGASLASPSA